MQRWVAGKLERADWQGPLSRSLAACWAGLAQPVRPVTLPAGARVIGVGGARLGGDGKTPVTIELARALARRGERVAVVVRRYPASLARPRIVQCDSSPASVGDEPLLAARALAPAGIPVIATSDYTSGIAAGAALAPTVLVDGLLQTRPRRLTLSLLVIGRGQLPPRCPPAGDLRASWQRLCRASDVLLLERDSVEGPGAWANPSIPELRFEQSLGGVQSHDGALDSLVQLRTRRFGLVLAIARPARVLAALAAQGLTPAQLELYPDHHSFPATPRAERAGTPVELWLTTGKCAVKLGPSYRDAPLWTLEHRVNLPPTLIERLSVRDGSHPESPW